MRGRIPAGRLRGIVTSALILGLTRDKRLSQACLDQSMEAIATLATRWRLFGLRTGVNRATWLRNVRAVVEASRHEWAAELIDRNGRVRVLTLSRAARYVQHQDVVLEPDATSELCLALMHSLLHTAQASIESALLSHPIGRPRRVAC